MLIVDQEKALRQSHIKQSVLSLKKTNVCENFFNQWNFDFGIATYFIFVTIEQSFSVPIDKIGSWQWVTNTIGICRFLQFEIFYVGYRARISFHCFVLSCKCVTLHTLFTSIVCVCICVCTWKCLSQTLWICVCGSCKIGLWICVCGSWMFALPITATSRFSPLFAVPLCPPLMQWALPNCPSWVVPRVIH